METINIATLPIDTGDTVLDLGCGEGRHTIALNYHFPKANIYGFDLSISDINTAKHRHSEFIAASNKNSASNTPNTLYAQADAFRLPFRDNSLNHIVCSEVLEHIEDYKSVLEEIKRVLKPHGSLSISVPRAWPEKICWALSKKYHQVEGGHVRIFNTAALQNEIIKQKFSFQKSHGAHALHAPYWWLRCLFWREHEQQNICVRAYHKILVWDLMKKPWVTRNLERCLNPILGKSVVLYFEND